MQQTELADELERAADRLERSAIGSNPMIRDAIRALRDGATALRTEQPASPASEAGEPVAWMYERNDGQYRFVEQNRWGVISSEGPLGYTETPLFSRPEHRSRCDLSSESDASVGLLTDARIDSAYYEGARQALRMAEQSMDAARKWVLEGCGGRAGVYAAALAKLEQGGAGDAE